MPTPTIHSIGLFIDGGYYQKINAGLRESRKNPVTLHNLIGFVQLAVARHYELPATNCIVTESHFFQGQFPVDKTDVTKRFKDRAFEDELIEEDVIFHYKHIHMIGSVYQEKGIDVWFALESYELAQYRDFDFVVLITGDADHEMLARKIKALKKQVVLLTWNFAAGESTSIALKEECTFHIDLARWTADNPTITDMLTGKRLEFSDMAQDARLLSVGQV